VAKNIYDQYARYTAKLDPPGFFRWLLEGAEGNLVFTRWLDTQKIPFPGEPDRCCDTVAELTPADRLGPPQALVAEFTTRPDADMLDRLLEYLAGVRRELRHGPHGRDRYPVAAALVQLTGPRPNDTLDMVLPGADGIGLRFKVAVRTLAEEKATETLAGIAAGQLAAALLPWVPLMQGGDRPEILAEWRRLAEMEPDSRRRAQYGSLALVGAELAGCKLRP
jgi:hypothetical protein